MFYTDEVMNFTAARQFCFSHEAEMVSILDEGELNFLKDARNSKYRFILKLKIKRNDWLLDGRVHDTSMARWNIKKLYEANLT